MTFPANIQEEDVKRMILAGESSKVEFKEDAVHNDRLAREIAAFANFKGGMIFLGVSDSGEIVGLSRDDNETRVMHICSSLVEPHLIPEYEPCRKFSSKAESLSSGSEKNRYKQSKRT